MHRKLKHTTLVSFIIMITSCTIWRGDPIALDEVDWEALLYQPGDLPIEDLSAYAYHEDLYSYIERQVPPAEYSSSLEFSGDARGAVTILIYPSRKLAKVGYESVVETLKEHRPTFATRVIIEGLGFQSTYDSPANSAFPNSESIIFYRCRAVILIEFSFVLQDGGLVYARRLDERLTPVVCQ